LNRIKYILLDSARLETEILKAKDLNKNYFSLFYGKDEEKSLSNVAPFLFSSEENVAFMAWFFLSGWGNSWGVLVHSSETLKDLYKHLSKLLMVQSEDGEELYFRFYDPRVLRIFLPTCDVNQLKEFFGPVDYFICEDEDPGFGLLFSLSNGNLNTEKLTKDQIMTFEPPLSKKKFSFF
jgi:hypothetical protein